jgi:hypothetical protein
LNKTILYGGPADQCRCARGNHRLEGTLCCKKHPRTEINHHHNRAFTFFLVQLDVCMIGARRNAPVHTANIITRLIGT